MSEGIQPPGSTPPPPNEPHKQPLRAKIATVENSVNQRKGDVSRLVQADMHEYPALSEFVFHAMQDALTPQEADLIGETALVVYDVMQSLPHRERVDPEVGEIAPDKAYIAVTQDDIEKRKKDKNSIYQSIKDDMANHEDLAFYVTEKMRLSVSLEEANLVGETALVVYDFLKDRFLYE